MTSLSAVSIGALAAPAAAFAPPSRETPVRIRGLSYTVGAQGRRARATPILAGVDLEIAPRQFVALVGPSGCGKSTLLNFLAGLLPPQAGSFSLGEQEQGRPRSVGYMFQQHGLLPWRTVQKNVELGLEMAGLPRAERADRAHAMLADMGLQGFEQHYPKEISGGMCQRVALARTLATQPDLLLMDEPFGALDAQTRALIHEMFSAYWETHRKTVLFVTHDLAEAVFLADRVLVMSARPGRIAADHAIDLPRPRRLEALRVDPQFHARVETLWQDIKTQSAATLRGHA